MIYVIVNSIIDLHNAFMQGDYINFTEHQIYCLQTVQYLYCRESKLSSQRKSYYCNAVNHGDKLTHIILASRKTIFSGM